MRLVFTLFTIRSRVRTRVYQQDIAGLPGLAPEDHLYPHEHFGERRVNASSDWASFGFEAAASRFCSKINLVPSCPLPPPEHFKLQP